jgi:hypothetical protein
VRGKAVHVKTCRRAQENVMKTWALRIPSLGSAVVSVGWLGSGRGRIETAKASDHAIASRPKERGKRETISGMKRSVVSDKGAG